MKTRGLLLLLIVLSLNYPKSFGQIYQHSFGTTTISLHPYTVAPDVSFDANLSNSSWINSTGTWTSFAGSSGQAIALANSFGTPTITLTFDVAAGYQASITSFNFWRKRSNTGATDWTMSINGTTVGSGTLPTTNGGYAGTTTVSGMTGLTGTITIVLSLSGGTNTLGTFRIDDFTLNGSVAIPTSSATDYFRCAASGNWSSPSTWQSSSDNSNWITATLVPDNNAAAITVQSGYTVTIDAAAAAQFLTVETGGTLVHTNGISLNITNSTNTYDFIVNGTYVLQGTQPVLTGSTKGQVNGLVRVDLNTGGESDNFARNTRIYFTTGSVFEWSTTQLFETGTSGVMTYFPNSASGVTAIFRVTATMGTLGSNSTTQFLGKFEVTGATAKISFVNTGSKIFRDGLGGSGTLTHEIIKAGSWNDCGTFILGDPLGGNITTPIIDGTLNIRILNAALTTDFEIDKRATATISGNPTIQIGVDTSIGSTFLVSGTLTHNSTSPVLLTYGNLTDTGFISGTGTFTASSSNTTVTVGKTISGSMGTLNFTTGANTVYNFIMGLSSPASSTTCRIALGTDLAIANNLTLTAGILVTEDNLLTWNNSGGTLTSPTGTSYANSFIATCDVNGNALNYSIASSYDGSVGFRINNIGSSSGNITFPVGATFLNSGTSYTATPNRMMINNSGTTDYFTVVVKKELMIYTPLSGVNRVWYVSEGNPGGSHVTMSLYFTKRQWSGTGNTYPSEQDEIEAGFLFSDPHLVQQTYTYQFVSNSVSGLPPTGDVPDYSNSSSGGFPYGTEISAQYRFGISPDLFNAKDGIKEFTRFSVFNANNIILPVSVTNFKAFQKGNDVQIEWSALNEINVDHYEIERSTNAVTFQVIATIAARNNNSPVNNYLSFDPMPANGKNFYRIKITDKNSNETYTSTVAIDLSNNKISVNIIPNPVRNKTINIQLNNVIQGRYNLLLYSMDGKMVYQKIIEHPGNSSVKQVVLPSSIRPGTYLVKLYNENTAFKLGLVVE